MRRVPFLILIAIVVISCSRSPESGARSVLIYTRNGEGYVHKNIAASVAALEEICSELNIKTEATDDPAIFEDPGFFDFDAVIFSNSNNEAFLNELQCANFQKFIRSGKGFVGIHSACGSERDWPWFWSLLGGKFVRHPPLQAFDIKVVDPDHISTQHLPDPWKWEDECYYIDHLNPGIHILIAADLLTVEDKKRMVYPGTVFGDYFPLAWYQEFEGGRSWYTALGHQVEHYEDTHFRDHLAGGIQWVLNN